MAKACQDHIDDTGILGIIGHTGDDGSSPYDRMKRYGQWGIWAAENISYRSDTAEDIVMQLYIDDGVASRGHRHNLMDEKAAVTGVATGEHSIYDIMACITYAGSYDDNTGSDLPSTISSTAQIFVEIVDLCSQAEFHIHESLMEPIEYVITDYEQFYSLDFIQIEPPNCTY